MFEYTTCENVHSIAEAAELEPSREKEHAVHHVLQEWVMLYLWETFYSLWVLKQPITPSNHQYRHKEQTLTNRDERRCNSCGVEVFWRNTDHKYCRGRGGGAGVVLVPRPFFPFCEMVWIKVWTGICWSWICDVAMLWGHDTSFQKANTLTWNIQNSVCCFCEQLGQEKVFKTI